MQERLIFSFVIVYENEDKLLWKPELVDNKQCEYLFICLERVANYLCFLSSTFRFKFEQLIFRF